MRKVVVMDYGALMQASADYIETHLKDELSVDTLARQVGFSPYHFFRLFTLFFDMPVMEYVRRRRLAHAAAELSQGRKILEVAIDYGFETHNGFNKAFKKTYGYAPAEYRTRVSAHRPLRPNPLGQNAPHEGSELVPEVCVAAIDAFWVAGFVMQESGTVVQVHQLPALWQTHRVHDYDSKLYAMAKPTEHAEYYICFPSGHEATYAYLNCVKVDTSIQDPKLVVHRVPASLYAIVTTPPAAATDFVRSIQETWRYFYQTWLPASDYVVDQSKPDYERYDERCHGDTMLSMEMYIPVQLKRLSLGADAEVGTEGA